MQFAVLGCDLKPFATFAETCPLDSKQLSAPFVKFKGIGPKSRFGGDSGAEETKGCTAKRTCGNDPASYDCLWTGNLGYVTWGKRTEIISNISIGQFWEANGWIGWIGTPTALMIGPSDLFKAKKRQALGLIFHHDASCIFALFWWRRDQRQSEFSRCHEYRDSLGLLMFLCSDLKGRRD